MLGYPRHWCQPGHPVEEHMFVIIPQLRRHRWDALYLSSDPIVDPDHLVDIHESSDDRILTVLDSWVRSEEDKRLSSL
jgi:hypothetical protein